MTEAEWLAGTDPEPMLLFIREIASVRQFRLFAVSAVWPLAKSLGDTTTQKVVEVVSVAAEGTLIRGDLRDERDKIGTFSYPTVPASSTSDYITRAVGLSLGENPLRAAMMMASAVAHLEGALYTKELTDQMSGDLAAKEVRRQCHCRLASHVRDIFGNPFRSNGIKRQWRTSTALALAEQMYGTRDFSAMPILADALQDAGCDNEDILNHCREPSEHCRGCWALDLLLDKK